MERQDEDLSTRDIAGASATTETETEARTGERMMPEGAESAESRAADLDTGGAVGPLLGDTDQRDFQSRWAEIQTRFVDDPRRAVEDGDALVATLMQRLAETFADERANLEKRWDGEGDVSTEDLRVALQRYRSFFDRLLSA